MKNTLFALTALSLLFLWSCSNNSETPGVDCSLSDLEVTVSSTTPADCDNPGTVEVSGNGGTEPYMFNVGSEAAQSSGSFSLDAGTYTITITDADGCTSTVSATVGTSGNAVAVSLSSTDSECGNDIGTITANASGGDGNYSYTLDGGSSQSSNEFTGVSNGSHSIEVTDGEGCSTTQSIIVSSGTSWDSDIMPIINANCAVSGCHNGDNGSSRNWTVLANVQANASNIKNFTGARSMPPPSSGRSLTDAEIELIACWVDDGAEDN